MSYHEGVSPPTSPINLPPGLPVSSRPMFLPVSGYKPAEYRIANYILPEGVQLADSTPYWQDYSTDGSKSEPARSSKQLVFDSDLAVVQQPYLHPIYSWTYHGNQALMHGEEAYGLIYQHVTNPSQATLEIQFNPVLNPSGFQLDPSQTGGTVEVYITDGDNPLSPVLVQAYGVIWHSPIEHEVESTSTSLFGRETTFYTSADTIKGDPASTQVKDAILNVIVVPSASDGWLYISDKQWFVANLAIGFLTGGIGSEVLVTLKVSSSAALALGESPWVSTGDRDWAYIARVQNC